MDNFTFGGKTLECLTEKEKKTAKMNRTLAFLKTKSAPGGGGGRVHLGILGWAVPPCCPIPDPISYQKMSFSHPFSDPTSKIHTYSQTWPV